MARPGWHGQVGKARLARSRPGWQGRIIKARSDQTGRIGKRGQVAKGPSLQVSLTNGTSRLKRGPKGALAKNDYNMAPLEPPKFAIA